jgi:regulatory protein
VKGAPEQPETVARIICLRLLDRSARTRAELAAALARHGVPDEAARTVLDRFGAVGLIDDAALAKNFAEARHSSRGLTRRAISTQLRRRGVDDMTVEEAVSGIDAESELTTACALVESRLQRMAADVDPTVAARRLTAMLARKGYSADIATNAVRQTLTVVVGAHSLGSDAPDGP